MFEFFLALFGGAYYAGKYAIGSEKNSRKKAELSSAEGRIRDFIAYAGYKYAEGYFWKQYCKDNPWCWRNDVYKELKRELTDVFGENYEQKFSLYSEHNITLAYYLLLSKQGLVDTLRAGSLGFMIGGVNEYSTDIQIYRWVESNLNAVLQQKGYPPVRLVQVPHIGTQDWSLHGARLVFEHTLTAGGNRKRLW